jgi:2-hydroxy-6-oxonona-2,4-dienedioate hydrolase
MPAERDVIHRHNLAVLMLYREEAITELALRLHIANVLRDRMKGRSLARTDALAQALAGVHCPVWAIYGREDALYRGTLDALQGSAWRGLWISGAWP